MKKKKNNQWFKNIIKKAIEWSLEHKYQIIGGAVVLGSIMDNYDKSLKMAGMENEIKNLKTLNNTQSDIILQQQFSIGKLCERAKNKK